MHVAFLYTPFPILFSSTLLIESWPANLRLCCTHSSIHATIKPKQTTNLNVRVNVLVTLDEPSMLTPDCWTLDVAAQIIRGQTNTLACDGAN